MDKFQEIPVSEVHVGYFVESSFSRDFVKSESSLEFVKSVSCQFVKSKFSQFVKSMYLNLFGSRLGLVSLVAEQVQGAAM